MLSDSIHSKKTTENRLELEIYSEDEYLKYVLT